MQKIEKKIYIITIIGVQLFHLCWSFTFRAQPPLPEIKSDQISNFSSREWPQAYQALEIIQPLTFLYDV